ncbi:hypothetical protein Ciccas_010265 [Cichlidogyrus casuarinus]|uniref:G-protein coupled receptors family 1 profile domain-containing protein n=1 Tax=Cichlidogyrus casuarinus TaxID=1844966 RepID=A0ABD2PVP8_9PLAT
MLIKLGGIKYNHTICKINPKFLVANNLDIFMHQLVPIIVLISTTILISRKLKTRFDINNFRSIRNDPQKSSSRAEEASIKKPKRSKKKENLITKRLLLISSFFIFTSLPLVILNLIRNFKTRNCTLKARLPPYSNLLALSLNLFNTNFAVNFLFYVMTGKTFYKQAVALLVCDYRTFNALVSSTEEAKKKKIAHAQLADRKTKQALVNLNNAKTQVSILPVTTIEEETAKVNLSVLSSLSKRLSQQDTTSLEYMDLKCSDDIDGELD